MLIINIENVEKTETNRLYLIAKRGKNNQSTDAIIMMEPKTSFRFDSNFNGFRSYTHIST